MDKSIKQEKDINKINAMIQALDNTGVRMFMYYPQTKTITVSKKTCEIYQCKAFYENMPHSFIKTQCALKDVLEPVGSPAVIEYLW